MQRRLLSVLLFALLAAAASSTLLYKVISANSSTPANVPHTKVLVAAKDLEAGAVVAASDVRAMDWSAPVSPQWAHSPDDIVGRGLLVGINQGEPFPENRLAAKGAGGGLAVRIPPGMRAVAVRVDELTGMGRYIRPGARVDVLSTGSPARSADSENPSMVTRTILQNIQVLSTGQDVERNSKEQPAAVQAVNLLVTPEQAEVLSLAIAQNRIQLVLRNPMDASRVSVAQAAPPVSHPVAVRRPAAPAHVAEKTPEPKPELPVIEVIHGTKKVISQVGLAETQDIKQ